MLKRSITYENFFGEKVTKDFYFNLSKTEIMEMEMGDDNGSFSAYIQRIVEAQDANTLIREFKKILLIAYGVRSDDGERFIKSDQLREEFQQTNAYSDLFMELATDENAAAIFFKGILPADLQGDFDPTSKTISIPPLASPPPPPPE